jgi:hypothetical protein
MRLSADQWGTIPEDLTAAYPCDDHLEAPLRRLTRAVAVEAPADVLFRWLCQLRVAPYSYDWLDNLGRRSPRELTPGVDALAVGQRFMIFELVDFEVPVHLTFVALPRATRIFGPLSVTYAVRPTSPGRSRLVVRLSTRATGLAGRARAEALAWGDLVMMRRQLLNLKHLAERSARSSGPAH